MKPELEFWYEFASTYSYLCVMRIGKLCLNEGIEVMWRPFLLGPVFKSQGWDTSPFNIYESKGRYMWRDLERGANKYGIPFKKPTEFPRHEVLASRVALIAEHEGWCPGFSEKVFLANFAEDRDISDESVICSILESLGQEAARVLELALSDENKLKLRTQTEEAVRKGIFGAPSFVAPDGELFWGNDRLEDAVRWVKSGQGS